jgi:predicted acylesterase/phospholipase RssA
MGGAPDFFTPRVLPPFLYPDGTLEATSYYDVAPLRALGRLVDFDLINAGAIRFSVGAVNVRSGNFVYFDNATHHIRPEHVIASGSLPPGFPPTEIEGEYYWDGGLVSNTPLQRVLDSLPRQDTLAFQVDLWSARGELPRNLIERRPPEGDPLFQPHPDGQLVRYYMEDVTVKGAWAGPAAIQLFEHAMCDVARLPVREVVSATHYITDLTLGLGEVVFDYLKDA